MKTLELALVRLRGTKGYTEGRLYADGEFFCYTLEDEEREIEGQDVLEWKIPTITAIPRGRYELGAHDSPRFKRKLPILKGVDGFSYVLIHSGNKASNTEGCILVGRVNTNKKDGWISQSRVAESALTEVIFDSINNNIKVYITVV